MSSEEKKKRGRKPKKDVQENRQSDVKQHVIHLNIHEGEVTSSSNDIFEEDFCKYNPTLSKPNAYTESDSFSSQPFELDKRISTTDNHNVKVINHGTTKDISMNTLCGWCCHNFDTDYIGLPIKYFKSVFYVTGCFCSFECACANNFYTTDGNLNVWETYNLLNLMACKMQYKSVIYPAPPKKCLTIFGGYMDISVFRNFKNSSKILATNHFPQVSVVEQIEEVNDFFHKTKTDAFTFDHARLERFEEKITNDIDDHIKLNFKNTIDSTMCISSQS